MSLIYAQALLQTGPFKPHHVSDDFRARPRDFVELPTPTEPDNLVDLRVIKLRLIAEAMRANTKICDLNNKIERLDQIDLASGPSRLRSNARLILERESDDYKRRLDALVDQIVEDRLCA